MTEIVLYLVLGFVLLYYGAEWLVRSGCDIALRLRISQLIIGLSVVALGTSAPEMIVSLKAAIIGKGDVSIGNVIGSNIVNVLLILGLAAIINPLKVNPQLLKFDLIFCIIVSFGLWAFVYDHRIFRFEGIILVLALCWYIYSLKKIAERDEEVAKELGHLPEEIPIHMPLYKSILVFLLGLLGLTAGGHFFVEGSVLLAKKLNVSDAVIGLTVVAIGTSLPELATSLIAAIKKKQDISIGNIIGSNIFNICAIIGFVSVISPIECRGITEMDIYVMIGAVLILFPMMKTGKIISRLEGIILVLLYFAYIVYLWPK